MKLRRSAAGLGLLAALFVIGFALMGFEMLGSRYLNPYFGGSINTWASLISVVLFAMMVGYFAGGYAVDARPGVDLLAGSVAAAALCLLVIPPTADTLMQGIIATLGDGPLGVLTASLALSFAPVAFLSACSPFVVRLMLVDLEAGGKTTGLVYSVSTLGNVAGTLATTFWLIPSYGTRAITTAFGVTLVVLAGLLYLGKRGLRRGLETGAVAAVLACLLAWPSTTRAEPPRRESWEAAYPEGPLWVGDRLLYGEMPLDRVMEWKAGRKANQKADQKTGERRVFWTEPGCGPTAIAAYRNSGFIVLCHLGARLVHLDAGGRKVGQFTASATGEALRKPNDGHTDRRGGVFFTDAGTFAAGAPATGKVFHLAADGTLRKVLEGLYYANGIAVDFAKSRLLVSEHLAGKVWQLDLRDDLSVANRAVFLDLARYFAPEEIDYAETGPDGIEVDSEGYVYVPVYGAGRMMIVAPDGTVSKVPVPVKFVTNVAVSGGQAVIVGASINDRPPFSGRVDLLPRATLLDLARKHVASPAR
jgi:sugar lactone lactonase YvrE